MRKICELKNINKSYGKHKVLNNISITVYGGEMVAITGKSGSGKTTLLNILGLLEKPEDGSVLLFDEKSPRIGSLQANKILREKLSYLFQNFALIDNATIDNNLEIPLLYSKKTKREKRELKLSALKKVGLNVSLNQKIHELSGGEQQRVAIARILLRPCELVLADEPTGSLDTENRDDILRILKELNNEGKTIIIVTHDKCVSEACHRTVELI